MRARSWRYQRGLRDFCVFISVELIWIYAISCLRRFENGRLSDISRDPSPVPGSFSSSYFHFHLLFIFIFLRSTRGRSPMVCRNVPFLHVAAFRGVGRSQTDQSLSLTSNSSYFVEGLQMMFNRT